MYLYTYIHIYIYIFINVYHQFLVFTKNARMPFMTYKPKNLKIGNKQCF